MESRTGLPPQAELQAEERLGSARKLFFLRRRSRTKIPSRAEEAAGSLPGITAHRSSATKKVALPQETTAGMGERTMMRKNACASLQRDSTEGQRDSLRVSRGLRGISQAGRNSVTQIGRLTSSNNGSSARRRAKFEEKFNKQCCGCVGTSIVENENPLVVAARRGDSATVATMLSGFRGDATKGRARSVLAQTELTERAMRAAARYGHAGVLRVVLRHGKDSPRDQTVAGMCAATPVEQGLTAVAETSHSRFSIAAVPAGSPAAVTADATAATPIDLAAPASAHPIPADLMPASSLPALTAPDQPTSSGDHPSLGDPSWPVHSLSRALVAAVKGPPRWGRPATSARESRSPGSPAKAVVEVVVSPEAQMECILILLLAGAGK